MSGSESPLEIVGGNIERSDSSPLVRRARSLPLAGAVLDWRPVRHAASARQLARLVREPRQFAAADLLGLSGVRRYHLRSSGRPVLIRHGTVDVWTFNEIFLLRLYEPPPAVGARLERAESPLIVDLGANIGMFGVDMLSRYPRARVIGYEPEPENAGIHRHLIEISNSGDAWQLVESAAGTQDGSVSFLPGLETGSRMVDGGEPGTLEVPMFDVLPLLAEAELVKLDIEGGEWDLLADPRFAEVRTVVLEYHPHGCPSDDPQQAAHELLGSHGFDVTSLFYESDSRVGMVWATRGEG